MHQWNYVCGKNILKYKTFLPPKNGEIALQTPRTEYSEGWLVWLWYQWSLQNGLTKISYSVKRGVRGVSSAISPFLGGSRFGLHIWIFTHFFSLTRTHAGGKHIDCPKMRWFTAPSIASVALPRIFLLSGWIFWNVGPLASSSNYIYE